MLSVPKRSTVPRKKLTQDEFDKVCDAFVKMDPSECTNKEFDLRVVEALGKNPVTKKMTEARGFRSLRDQMRTDDGGFRRGRKDEARIGRGITVFQTRLGMPLVNRVRKSLGRLHEKLS